MALGNGSITVAMTSMASSLEVPESPFFFSSLNCFAIVSCIAARLPDLKIGHYKGQIPTNTGRLPLWAPSESTARSRRPPRCARKALMGYRRRLPPPPPPEYDPQTGWNEATSAQSALGRRDPVNELAVHRSAQRGRIPAVALDRRLARLSGDFFLGQLFEVHRRNSRPHRSAQRRQAIVHDEPGAMHFFQLITAAQMNRHFAHAHQKTVNSMRPAHDIQHLPLHFIDALRGVHLVQASQPTVIRHQRLSLLLVRLQPRAH